MPDPVSSSVLICETVLAEGNGLLSAIRIMDTLTLPLGAVFARFFVLTRVHSQPGDFQAHVLQVRMASPRKRNGWKLQVLLNTSLFTDISRTRPAQEEWI